jgi:hypothetical protein
MDSKQKSLGKFYVDKLVTVGKRQLLPISFSIYGVEDVPNDKEMREKINAALAPSGYRLSKHFKQIFRKIPPESFFTRKGLVLISLEDYVVTYEQVFGTAKHQQLKNTLSQNFEVKYLNYHMVISKL